MDEAEGRPADLGNPPGAAAQPFLRPTPMLLQGQDYFFRSPDTPLDFQERMFGADLVADEPGDPVPCVLVLARAADMEMNELSLALAEHDIRMVRIDADRSLDLALTIYTDTPLIEFQRWLLRPVLVWRRHFDISAIPVDPTTVHGAYVREQWSAVANWLACRSDWDQVNSVRSTEHLDRLTQLQGASAVGLRVPRTAVTTMPGRSRPGGGRCIVKTAGHHLLEPEPGALRGLFPRPLDIRLTGEAREPAPVLVQQYLDADHELRVFVIGDRAIGFRVQKLDPAQLWVDPDSVVVERVEVPEDLVQRLLALCRQWRLDVAGFDLLGVGGEWVFLEVNVNCDWRWFEHRADCADVSTAVHDWVRSRFTELSTAKNGWGSW
ncbi:ATP-grasp domain-containing protein [Saccharopolyspora sp. NPDC003752]